MGTNKNMVKTLSINKNFAEFTKIVTSNLGDLPTSTKVSALSPTVFIKTIPTAVNHDTVYKQLSTATSAHTVSFSQSKNVREPSITPAADLGGEMSDNHPHAKEGYKSLTTTHKLAIGLGVGFGCLAIIGLVILFLQNYKKKQRISHHSPNDTVGKKLTENLRSLPSSNDINTRWRPNSFLGVVASVVARLPASRSSGSVVGMVGDTSKRGSLNITTTLHRET